MKTKAFIAVLASLVIGCQSPSQKLMVAENTVTAAQDTWTGMLTNRTVKDRATIVAGTAAINHASAAVGKAYVAYKASATQPTIDADWFIDFALDVGLDAAKYVAKVQAEQGAK